MATVTVEEKAKAEEKANVEKVAAVTGAQAVADAVTKVANAAVDAARNASNPSLQDFVVTGQPGNKFEIRGNGFSSGGSVLVGGKAQQTYEWGPEYIRGKLDADVKSGEIVVQIDSQTKKTGYLKV